MNMVKKGVLHTLTSRLSWQQSRCMRWRRELLQYRDS
jgi:hypothetical protein